jgi:small-conductance mechanosensitive channel
MNAVLNHPLAIKAAVFAISAILLAIVVRMVAARYVKLIDDIGRRRQARQIVNISLLALIAIAAAFTFSNSLAGLAVSFGVLGAAIAFALQQVLASAVAWLQILFGNVYRPGDRVKVGGVIGDVIKVNVFLTTLMEVRGDWVNGDQYTGRVVLVPNAAIYQTPAYNYSTDFEYLWDELTVPIKYGSDRALAVKIMQDAVAPLAAEATEAMRKVWPTLQEQYYLEDAILEPSVFLVANDNWLEYGLRYLVHYKRRRTTKSALCEAIISEIEKNPEKVGIASGTYDVVGLPTIKVDLGERLKDR